MEFGTLECKYSQTILDTLFSGFAFYNNPPTSLSRSNIVDRRVPRLEIISIFKGRKSGQIDHAPFQIEV